MSAGHLFHLATRFAGSLRPGPPPPPDEDWARSQLLAGERELWEQMSNPDRRHAIAVARAVSAELGQDAGRDVVAAALLHDVGKVVCGFGTFTRVGATVVWAVVDDDRVGTWTGSRRSLLRRLAQYRRHPELGGELLRRAGADPLTSAWAEEHHRPAERWTVPSTIGGVLKRCDDD